LLRYPILPHDPAFARECPDCHGLYSYPRQRNRRHRRFLKRTADDKSQIALIDPGSGGLECNGLFSPLGLSPYSCGLQEARMATMKTLCFLGLCLLVSCPAVGQAPSGFVTGITLLGGAESCPVFVAGVGTGSPAEQAGISSGDVLAAVNGIPVSTIDETVKKFLHSESPKPVTLALVHQEKPYVVTVGRVRSSMLLGKQNEKVLEGGLIVPLDATETEMNGKSKAITRDRFVDRVFPTHYPRDEKLYYSGFEVLILKNPAQVVVLGIEDGPASRAGVHWGDTILSVNGVDPRHKSVTELEPLFSSQKPGSMTLKIGRNNLTNEFTYQLAEAAQILRDNQRQLLQGQIVPLGLPERYLYCFK